MKKILTILFLLTCTLIKTARADQYSKHWILKTNEDAHKLAEQNNFRIIRSFTLDNQNYHIAQPDYHRLKRSTDDSHEHLDDLIKQSEKRILSDPSVSLFEREKILKRTKRDYVAPPQSVSTLSEHQKELAKQQLQQGLLERIHREYYMQSGLRPNLKRLAPIQDPMWSEMWYLNRHSSGRDLPDMNVTGAWSQGYSGRGVSVTFLDDGLEHDHPDIQQNYDPKASDDINDNDSDPMPRYDDSNENKHGTRCAGEVAAVANNSICSVGVAFNAGIGGIRMLDGDVTDSVEARSLSFNRDHIDIYSASWGPDDNGEVVDGPGPLAKQAFIEGVTQGRKGLGSIFVWASGNGGRFSDSCSCDGYANSIYTLSISSTSENSEKPWYLEECTSTLATTYSSGDERMNEREVVTTDLRHQCTKKHTGTSAAAPIAAGIVALALEANSKLTWRDVMYLIVLSSRPKAIKSNNFIINKRGFMVSSRYGFGLMDAGRMVELAKNWQNVPLLRTCQTLNSVFKVKSVQKQDAIEATLTTDACLEADQEVNFIEQVEIVVTIQAPVRGNLEIYLTSPMGTFAQILPKRPKDQSNEGFKRWSFMTVQLWGEMPRGDWKLLVASTDQTVRLEEFFLNIHGTKEKPIEYENLINMKSVIDLQISEASSKPVLDSMSIIRAKLSYISKQIQNMFNGINSLRYTSRT